jgi:15-cis-phytoene synthase
MTNQNYLSIYAKSFNWAGFFLPKQTYQKCSDLYDFCRVIDNIADEKSTIKLKETNFNNFENDFNKKNFNNLIIKNMWKLIDEFDISLKIIHDLFQGIKSDIKEKVKLNSRKELLVYSYRVAGTVGLMMAKILKVKKRNSLKSAIDLGIAMQLTNISRDVIEDLYNSRSYINENFEDIKSTLELAERFYQNSFLAIGEIPINFRFSILVARRVYRKIGYKILKKKDYENYKNSGKIYVSNIEKTVETFLAIFDLIKLFFKDKDDDNVKHDHFLINEELNLDERI